METTYSFGYWVRRQRKALDLSQRELAERAACSLSAIKKIEQDKRRPSRELAEILADCLAIPEEDRENFLNSARGLAPVDALPVAGQPLSAASSPEQPVADSSPDTTMEAAVQSRQPPRRPKWIVPAVLLILVLGAVLFVLAVRDPDLLSALFSSSPGTSNELTYGADTPQGVLDTIVEVAETGDFIPLYGLCDPLAEHDENAAYVCALATATDKRRLFRRAFAASEVVGEIVYSTDGQQAEMTFSHGPAGGIIKTAKLVQRDGRWYLLTWPPLPDDTD